MRHLFENNSAQPSKPSSQKKDPQSRSTLKAGSNKQILGDDQKYLRLKKWPNLINGEKTLRLVDLFCGCGGISLGFALAAHDLGFGLEIPLAVDFEPSAIACYKKNFPKATAECADVATIFSRNLRAGLTPKELQLQESLGRVDVLVGGPPCQGHSDLNNYTRRRDPKNQLMETMIRAAIVLKPQAIVIENVVGSLKDRGGVVQTVQKSFQKIGYSVNIGILNFAAIGVPQRRKRMVMIAIKTCEVRLDDVQKSFTLPERSISWAIKDIAENLRNDLVDRVAVPQSQTKKRIDYLFEHNLYELPNEERPPCHRDKAHSYDTVYGRLRWEKPAQTITSGFYCMCMGRYIHPSQRRTLTAREAARLQFFPDFYDFAPAQSRTKLAEIIGNAVPPKGSYAIARSLLPILKLASS